MTKCKSRISCLVLRNESVSSQHNAAFAAAAAENNMDADLQRL